MQRTLSVGLALSALAFGGAARAQAPVSFEAALGQLRRQVRATMAEQAQAKQSRLAQDIERLARDAGRLQWDARRLRDRVADLRRRAQRADRTPPRPGQPPRNNDPFFESDLRRTVWDLRDLKRAVEGAERDAGRYAAQATKDPELVRPAESLDREARGLQSDAQWLASEARWARMDLQRAGYNFEAWDIERESDDSQRAAQDLEREARALLSKVR